MYCNHHRLSQGNLDTNCFFLLLLFIGLMCYLTAPRPTLGDKGTASLAGCSLLFQLGHSALCVLNRKPSISPFTIRIFHFCFRFLFYILSMYSAIFLEFFYMGGQCSRSSNTIL